MRQFLAACGLPRTAERPVSETVSLGGAIPPTPTILHALITSRESAQFGHEPRELSVVSNSHYCIPLIYSRRMAGATNLEAYLLLSLRSWRFHGHSRGPVRGLLSETAPSLDVVL